MAKKLLSIRTTDEVNNAIKKMAKDGKVSQSKVIEELVLNEVKKQS